MKIVMQCAASKNPDAGRMRSGDGTPVLFVADPAVAPPTTDLVYARPDDLADDGRSWRTKLQDYNRSPGNNPLKLLRAVDLYEPPAYGQLAVRYGADKLWILSAGWGLLPSTFLTPAYDITFTRAAERYKRRFHSDRFDDFGMPSAKFEETIVFLGGRDYVPHFTALTRDHKGPRVVFYNATEPPVAAGCVLERFVTRKRLNWHYECAQALIEGRLDPALHRLENYP